jgi:two-component system sensor histidine kinase GlrK
MKLLMHGLRRLSLRGLVLSSVGLTLLPLLLGLVSVVLTVQRLAILSEQTVHHVAGEFKASQVLQDYLEILESRGSEYLRTQDENTLKQYRLAHNQFGEQLQTLANSVIKNDSPLWQSLHTLENDETVLFNSIIALFPPQPDTAPILPPANPQTTLNRFQSIKIKARELAYEYAAHVESEATHLESQAAEVKHRLVIHLALLLPVSGILLAICFYLLQNPMQQIDHVIRALGTGNFTRPISVVGPGDVEFLGERLEWLRTRLNDLETAKQRFVRNVSHEIKTPLATIHEGTDLLLDEVVGELNREQKDIARILVSNTDKLDKLIGELINYSQVSNRREHQKVALVDMRRLVLNILEDYRLQLRGKSLTVHKFLAPLEFMGDAEQLRTIIDNLLSNAVKYSPEGGGIRLLLRKNGGHMELEIEDDGPGIDPDERNRVCEPFFQGRMARSLAVKGTGLGLAIVAECVANHHGKVEILESLGDNAGARIRVRIPM